MSHLTQSPAWQALQAHKEELKSKSLGELVLGDAERLDHCEIDLDGLRFNYALNRVTPKTIELLVKLAQQQGLENARTAMFRGDKINNTENRAVLHTALRAKDGKPVMADGRDVTQDIKAVRAKMAKFTGDVRGGVWKGATGKPIRYIVNIGIGGSDLGPRLVVRALDSYTSNLKTHFVANADAFDLLSVLKECNPEETLFVVVSKTFTTQETLLNAQTARQWLTAKLGERAVAQHFVAVSVNIAEAEKFGIAAANIFPIWDWVGGRYSLWSAVGLSIALAIGADNFGKLCDGAAAVDAHFTGTPLAQNIPVLMGLLSIWHRNFWDMRAQAILPYSERLRELPRYLQQLEMESNGKSVTTDGAKADATTSPIIFGESGTVGQHSFHQWLHQGSDIAPADFIGIVADDLNQPNHHRAMLTNMLAQAGALAFGKTADVPQNTYDGNRPSSVILLDRLDPYHLGMLLALYEHKIFVAGVILGINSFDQPGVELGKQMARALDKQAPASDKNSVFLAGFMQRINRS